MAYHSAVETKRLLGDEDGTVDYEIRGLDSTSDSIRFPPVGTYKIVPLRSPTPQPPLKASSPFFNPLDTPVFAPLNPVPFLLPPFDLASEKDDSMSQLPYNMTYNTTLLPPFADNALAFNLIPNLPQSPTASSDRGVVSSSSRANSRPELRLETEDGDDATRAVIPVSQSLVYDARLDDDTFNTGVLPVVEPPPVPTFSSSDEVRDLVVTMASQMAEMHRQMLGLQSELSMLNRTVVTNTDLPVVSVISTPWWGAFREAQCMHHPVQRLHLLPEWQAQRREAPVQFTADRCDPSIKISLRAEQCDVKFEAFSRTMDIGSLRSIKFYVLDNSTRHYAARLDQAAAILHKTFKYKKSYFASMIRCDDITTVVAVDEIDDKVVSVCIVRTAVINADKCVGIEHVFGAADPVVVCVCYAATDKLFRRKGLSNVIVEAISTYVDSKPGSMMVLQSAYVAVKFWKKYASHTRLAVNMVYALYELDPAAFEICEDTLEFMYMSKTTAKQKAAC